MRAEALPLIFDSNDVSRISSPFRYDSLSIEKGHRPVGFRFFQHIINIKASIGNREMVVTGEANSLELAHAKARSELIERSALISFADDTQAETSNGWAAHPSKAQTTLNAVFELVERDAVLSQWYSATPFLQVPTTELPTDLQHWATDELSRSEYPELLVLLSSQGLGPSVSCILKNANGFGVSGHATRATLRESIESALAEACRAAHATLRREYWGDTLKLKRGELGPANPGAHSVYYAYHEPFPNWMFGAPLAWAEANNVWKTKTTAINRQVGEFKFQTILESDLSKNRG